MKSLEERCAAFSLLEGWKLDPNLVARASQVDYNHNGEISKNLPIIFQEEILVAINTLQRSPVYGHDTDFTALLGLFNCHCQNWSKMSFICPPTPVKLITKSDTIFPFLTWFSLPDHDHHPSSWISYFGSNVNVWSFPGGVQRNSSGHIVAASTARWNIILRRQ